MIEVLNLADGSLWHDSTGARVRVDGVARDWRTLQERVVFRWLDGPQAGDLGIPPLEEFGRYFAPVLVEVPAENASRSAV